MSRCCVYDFTSSFDKGPSIAVMNTWLKKNCKKWAFQKEKGATGYIHYQGRFSLKQKQQMGKFEHPFSHISTTSKENSKNNFYVLKDDTRIEGPWLDTDPYIPRQCENFQLRPFQNFIVKHRDDDRVINIIVDNHGGIGKTSLGRYLDTSKNEDGLPKGTYITFANDYRDIMRQVFAQPKTEIYIVDIPRAIPKKKLNHLFAAIETMKDGLCWDDRYEFRKTWFEPPTIWVFTNEQPIASWLSKDRWKFWSVNRSTWNFTQFDVDFYSSEEELDELLDHFKSSDPELSN